METAFYSMAVLCFVYYLVLIYHMKSLKTSFSWFWIVSAVICVVMGYVTSILPKWGVTLVNIVFIVALMVFLAIEIVIFCGMISMPVKKYSALIVLGAHVEGKKLCDTLKRRMEKALVLLLADKELKVIVSGGQGKGEEISEAEAMAEFLKSYAISSDRIIIENESHSTKENLENSLEYIEDPGSAVGIVTNNFHMYRALKQARFCGYGNPKAVMAGVDYILFLNYMVREFFCVIHMYLG